MYIRFKNTGLFFTLFLLLVLTILLLHIQANLEKYTPNVNEPTLHVDHVDTIPFSISNYDVKRAPERREDYKSILIYSTLFGLTYWPTLDLDEIKTFMDRCEYKQCNITYNKDELSNVDAVLFHGVDVLNEKEYTPTILRNVAKQKKPKQKWVFFIQESPDNYNGFDKYRNLFDWVMSYKYTSDIIVPYGHYKTLDKWDHPPSKDVDYAATKSNLAIWFASNCGRPRDEFMQELKRYLPFSVGGKCAKKLFNETIKCERGSNECQRFIKSHKFFFAFENTFCEYYVSEKYWQRGIDWGIVPIVMGARYDRLNVIPGSYIDALQFSSIKRLADYIKYLDSNDTAYNEYFIWRQKFKRIGYEKMCQLCKSLHTNEHSRPYTKVWSDKLDCKPFQWKVDLLKTLVKDSKSNNL